jgi:hypothetical protein
VDEQLVHLRELQDSGEPGLLRRDLDALAGGPLFELEGVDRLLLLDEAEVVVFFVGPSGLLGGTVLRLPACPRRRSARLLSL